MKIPKDKAARIGQELMVPLDCGEEGLFAAKRSLSMNILKEVAKKIEIYETWEEDVVKLRADILLVNYEDLEE